MYDKIHERITVKAIFEPGKRPRIKSFIWQGSEHIITRITLVNQARRGRELVWLFHVTTETMAFKLRLDTDSMSWWVEEKSWEVIHA